MVVIFDEKNILTHLLILEVPLRLILYVDRRRTIMSENYNPIDVLVSEIRGNAEYLNKLIFPKVGLILGIVGGLVAIFLLIK